LNSGETPDATNIQRSSSAASESHETENCREPPPGAAELAVRQGFDAEDELAALWAPVARSSAHTELAFGLDGAE